LTVTLRQRRGESSQDHGDSGASRPPLQEGVEYRLGSSIVKTASPKKDHGDQAAGRDGRGGTKKRQGSTTIVVSETLDDLQQNEDERGSIPPLLKTNSEAAGRGSSRRANVLRRLDSFMRGGQLPRVENRNCEPFQPRPRRPPIVFKPCGSSFCRKSQCLLASRSSVIAVAAA
jgi:hypothetical protein